MRKRRPKLLFAAILLVGAGVAWSVWQQRDDLGEGGVPTKGTVVSVRRDSLGCKTWLPFAAAECRTVVKIRHHVEGAAFDQDFLQAVVHHYSAGPKLGAGDAVTGTCTPAGRCAFEQLKERPWALYGFLLSIAGVLLLVGRMLRQREARTS